MRGQHGTMLGDVKNPASLRKITDPALQNNSVSHLIRLARRVPDSL
jgi:hypothetical protein